MTISPNDKRAYSEIYYVLGKLDDGYREKIPDKLMDFFENARDKDYEVKYDTDKPLYMQDYQEYTFDLLNILNVNYWCDDEEMLGHVKNTIKNTDGAFKLVDNAYEYEKEKEEKEPEENKKDKKIGFFKNLKNIFK